MQAASFIRAIVPRPLRNWARSPRKSASWIWDEVAFRIGRKKRISMPKGLSLKCPPRAYSVFLDAQINDPEQADEFKQFLSHCRRGMVLFDVGCHFGIFSLATSHLGGIALAVDPSTIATRMVKRLMQLNEECRNINILRAAVSDKSGSIGLLDSGVFSDGYFRFEEGRNDATEVSAVTIDELVPKYGPPTHLKIDVEGHELEALRGARSTLETHKPLVFLELHSEMIRDKGKNPDEVLDELRYHGYTLFELSGFFFSLDERPLVRMIAIPVMD